MDDLIKKIADLEGKIRVIDHDAVKRYSSASNKRSLNISILGKRKALLEKNGFAINACIEYYHQGKLPFTEIDYDIPEKEILKLEKLLKENRENLEVVNEEFREVFDNVADYDQQGLVESLKLSSYKHELESTKKMLANSKT